MLLCGSVADTLSLVLFSGHGFDGYTQIMCFFCAEGETNVIIFPCSSVLIRVPIFFPEGHASLRLSASGCG